MKDLTQRLLFLTASAAILAVCWKAVPAGENAAEPLEDGPPRDVPFYTHYDEVGNLQLELYFDPGTGQGKGARYDWDSLDGQREVPVLYPFTFDSTSPDEAWGWLDAWQEPYSVKTIWGTDGAEAVEGYQETWEYDDSGKPVRFSSQGSIDDPNFTTPVRVLEFEFFYREDGSLCRKSYHHESWLFGTTGSTAKAYYDGLERPVFVRCYITHGSLEFYYIYQSESRGPDYCLCLDFNGGECWAELHPYE